MSLPPGALLNPDSPLLRDIPHTDEVHNIKVAIPEPLEPPTEGYILFGPHSQNPSTLMPRDFAPKEVVKIWQQGAYYCQPEVSADQTDPLTTYIDSKGQIIIKTVLPRWIQPNSGEAAKVQVSISPNTLNEILRGRKDSIAAIEHSNGAVTVPCADTDTGRRFLLRLANEEAVVPLINLIVTRSPYNAKKSEKLGEDIRITVDYQDGMSGRRYNKLLNENEASAW